MKFYISTINKLLCVLSVIFIYSGCNHKESNNQEINTQVVLSQQTYKPWAYWWWMGNSVTKEGISKNLKSYKEAGLGGLHIVPIYGEKGDEENFIQYLSPEWMEILVHTVNEANILGLGIDMTTGTGWPFGGPNIDFENAAKRFVLKEINLNTEKNISKITAGIKNAKLIALSRQKNDSTYENIIESIQDDGSILNTSTHSKAFALVMYPTKQKVKRAAPGGKGLVIDYFNKTSLNNYFNRFQSAFESTQFKAGKVRAFYNDSYEVYGANITSNFLNKFKELRGYDLTNFLHVIADSGASQNKERIVTDYCETISDLLYSEFSLPWVEKSHEIGMFTRNQAHGSPGNLLDLYGASDIPETESFGVSDFSIPGLKLDPDFEEERFGRPNPLTMKFASSAAHIKNKKLVSSETATWLGDHFKVALSQVKPQIDELFTAGINHVIYHGITYNPPEKPFPGRLFYASTNFGTKSHFWNELPELNKYIERCQKILQNSKPHNDVLVYFPIHDIWAKKYTKELIIRFDVHHSENWLKQSNFGDIVSSLWKEGYTFDYVSDKMITDASIKGNKIQFEGGSYKTIVIPKSTYMPEKTLEKLTQLSKAGANIIFQDKLPKTIPGFFNNKERNNLFSSLKTQIKPLVKITNDIISELQNTGISNEDLAKLGLSFIRKIENGEVIYFISNLGDNFSRGKVNLATESNNVLIFNPLNGESHKINSKIENGKTIINLKLEPGQSCILRCKNSEFTEQKILDYTIEKEALVLDSEWTITPINEDEDLPATIKTADYKSWPLFGDDWSVYSGKAIYTCDFQIDETYIGQEMLIDLGDVRETARIKINDSDIGLLWCIPYKTIIPKNILKRNNKIEIEVVNLSFNKVIELDKRGVKWKNFHEINFVNIKYEPYDASNKEPIQSGLLSKIKLSSIVKNTEKN